MITKKIKASRTFQKLQNLYNEKFGYISKLRNTNLYSSYLELCKIRSKEIFDSKKETIADLKIENFKKNLNFKPDSLSPSEKKEYERILEIFDYSRSIYRKKLDYSEEGIYSPDFFRGIEQQDPHISVNLNPTKDNLYKSQLYHNAAYIHMKKNLEIPKDIKVATDFKNKWIKDYFQGRDTSTFLLNNFEGFSFDDDYKFWRSNKKHSYLKTLVPHDNLNLFSKGDFIYKGKYINMKFFSDFHPEVFLFKRSSPSISVRYKHNKLNFSPMTKTEKIFRRLFWNEYSKLREIYKTDPPYFYTILGKHEIIPKGFAKKGHYFIQLNKTLEELTNALPEVRSEMKNAVSQVADIKWIDIFNDYDKKKFSSKDIEKLNKALRVHQSPVQLIYKERN